MRAPILALIGLLVAAGPALAARTSDRGAGAAQRTKAVAAAPGNAAKPARAHQRTAPAMSRKPERARGQGTSSSVRGRSTVARDRRAATAAPCRRGQRHCRGFQVAAPTMRWSQGLIPAVGFQTVSCPAGTMATLATGHADVVRCMPI
jgi:hypothetical protein